MHLQVLLQLRLRVVRLGAGVAEVLLLPRHSFPGVLVVHFGDVGAHHLEYFVLLAALRALVPPVGVRVSLGVFVQVVHLFYVEQILFGKQLDAVEVVDTYVVPYVVD